LDLLGGKFLKHGALKGGGVGGGVADAEGTLGAEVVLAEEAGVAGDGAAETVAAGVTGLHRLTCRHWETGNRNVDSTGEVNVFSNAQPGGPRHVCRVLARVLQR
jgi:hypothetical protein